MNRVFKKRIDNIGKLEIPSRILQVARITSANLLEIWINERGNIEIKKVEWRRR